MPNIWKKNDVSHKKMQTLEKLLFCKIFLKNRRSPFETDRSLKKWLAKAHEKHLLEWTRRKQNDPSGRS